jgi:hypothetical protein
MRNRVTVKPDTFQMTTRQRVGYRLIRLLGGIQQKIYTYVVQDHVWRSADGTCIPVKDMGHNHLKNAKRMLLREGSDRNDTWIDILDAEMHRRSKICRSGSRFL